MALYPVNIKITDKLCVIVGGGSVALRKARGLLEAGARVRVISPEFIPGLRLLARDGKIELVERGYAFGDLRSAFLAFAATGDPLVQYQILEEAKSRNVLLNSADDPLSSHFHVPAHFRRGQMMITVSTGGGSPALARRLRQQLEAEYGVEYGTVVDLLSLIRQEVVSDNQSSDDHRELFNRLLEKGIMDMVLTGNWFDLQMLLLKELSPSCDGVALLQTFMEKHNR